MLRKRAVRNLCARLRKLDEPPLPGQNACGAARAAQSSWLSSNDEHALVSASRLLPQTWMIPSAGTGSLPSHARRTSIRRVLAALAITIIAGAIEIWGAWMGRSLFLAA